MVPLLIVALLALFFDAATAAVSVTAVCDYAEWTAYNGLSPCQIWGNLQAVCDPNASVPPLLTTDDVNAHYPSPNGTGATPCQCNVVAYNLMAGCSWCQPGVYSGNWVSETVWKAGCSSYNPTGLPSQASSLSSSIPPWAFTVEDGEDWLSFQASSIAVSGGTPTASFTFAVPTETIAEGGIFGTSTAFGSSATGPFSGGDNGGDDNGGGDNGDGDGFDDPFNSNVTKSVGKTVGIAVGTVAGLWVLFFGTGLIICLVRQKRRKHWYGQIAAYYANGARIGDPYAAQPLLANGAYPNVMTTPPASAQAYPSSQQTTTPLSDAPLLPANAYPSQQYQQPMASQFQPPQPGHSQQYDASLLYQADYPNPSPPHMAGPSNGSTSHIPEL